MSWTEQFFFLNIIFIGVSDSSLLYGVLLDALLADEADVRHVSEVLVEVEGVTDHELVRDFEGDVVRGVAVALKGDVEKNLKMAATLISSPQKKP